MQIPLIELPITNQKSNLFIQKIIIFPSKLVITFIKENLN